MFKERQWLKTIDFAASVEKEEREILDSRVQSGAKSEQNKMVGTSKRTPPECLPRYILLCKDPKALNIFRSVSGSESVNRIEHLEMLPNDCAFQIARAEEIQLTIFSRRRLSRECDDESKCPALFKELTNH